MNKKIIAIFIVFLIILGNFSVFASTDVEFSISSQANVKAEDTIKLKITTKNIEEQEKKISGIKLDVFYDKENFDFISAEQLSAVNGAICLHENYAEEGRVRIGVASLMGIKKSGDIYEITLKAKQQVNKIENPVTLEIKEIIDSENNEIPYNIKNGMIKFNENITENNENNENNLQQENNEGKEIDINQENREEVSDENIKNNDLEQDTENIQEDNIQENIVTINKEERKNIKEFLKDDNTVNKEDKLQYEVENSEILEIDEEGNITPKQEGTTNIKITDEQGNTTILPITIAEESLKAEKTENAINVKYIVIVIAIIILIAGGFIYIRKKKNK